MEVPGRLAEKSICVISVSNKREADSRTLSKARVTLAVVRIRVKVWPPFEDSSKSRVEEYGTVAIVPGGSAAPSVAAENRVWRNALI